jgi:hypothetical protein
MIISFSMKAFGPTTVGIRRVVIAAAGVATLGVALYRAPGWLEVWNAGAVVGAIIAAATVLVLAIGVAVRGSVHAIERVATEIALLVCALIVAETMLLFRAPENWSDNPLVQRIVARERAAREQGFAYDSRLRADVVGDLQASGLDAVPGFAASLVENTAVMNAIRERGVLPLSNVANVMVVECNEGTGYLKFRSDQFGFNNPRGLSAGPIDIAVIGESLALGHCVAPSTSAVDRVRERFPRTANFGVAGSRVLSQLGVFREYVQPLEPAVVVWFVNLNFAEPQYESSQPVLMRYLNDASFSQGLPQRQREIDSFVRDVMVPLNLQRDRALREQLEGSSAFPFERVIRLSEVRSAIDIGAAVRRPADVPNLADFERAVDRVAKTAGEWGGRLIVVILPSYQTSVGRPRDMARYAAISEVLSQSAVAVVDGPALFAEEPDYLSLYTLSMDNHPSQRGHAVLGEAVIAAIDSREKQ